MGRARQQLYEINKVMSPCFISPIVSLLYARETPSGGPVIYRGTWGMQPAPPGAPWSPRLSRLLYLLHALLMDYFGISIVLRAYTTSFFFFIIIIINVIRFQFTTHWRKFVMVILLKQSNY